MAATMALRPSSTVVTGWNGFQFRGLKGQVVSVEENVVEEGLEFCGVCVKVVECGRRARHELSKGQIRGETNSPRGKYDGLWCGVEEWMEGGANSCDIESY